MQMVTWILPSFHDGLLAACGEPVSGTSLCEGRWWPVLDGNIAW